MVATNGYFIEQKGGQFYRMYEKLFLLHPQYFNPVVEYLAANRKQITLEAKIAFESENKETIAELLKQGKRTKQEKEGNNTKNMQQNTNTTGKWFT